jgi:hypothetical protein
VAREEVAATHVDAGLGIPASQIRPILLAAYTASARRETFSLRMMLPTWNFAVVSEM